jgi:hypothetical protein
MALFFYYIARRSFALGAQSLAFAFPIQGCPSLTRSEAHVSIDFCLSTRNGIRHDSSHHGTSQDTA